MDDLLDDMIDPHEPGLQERDSVFAELELPDAGGGTAGCEKTAQAKPQPAATTRTEASLPAARLPVAGNALEPTPRARRWPLGRLWLGACLVLAAWLALGGLDRFTAPGSRPAIDVPAASAPASVGQTVPFKRIEAVCVGDRVLSDDPDVDLPEASNVDPATWRQLRLHGQTRWEDGTLDTIHIETLQAPEWIAACGARLGAWVPVPLDLVEMGLPADLTAQVVADEPCPPIADGPGRVVLTTVNHLNRDVLELTVESAGGRRESLRPTGLHKFYSIDRACWLSAEDLEPGETLRGHSGPLTLIEKHRVAGVHRVYNMTVEGEHVYFASTLGVLAHNNGCGMPSGRVPRGGNDIVSLWKAPQRGRTGVQDELIEGFSRDRYPGDGPFFSTKRSVAEKYKYHYENGLQEVRMRRSEYDGLVREGVIKPDALEDASVHVPEEVLDRFNEVLKQPPGNVFHP